MEDHDHEPDIDIEKGFRSFIRMPLYVFGVPLTFAGGGLFLKGRPLEGELMSATGLAMIIVGLWLSRKK